MQKPKVVVAGHICIDITPMFPEAAGSAAGIPAPKTILVPGTLTRVDGVDIHAGGVVANTGLAMMLFGMDVSLMGKIGKDAFGSMIFDLLRERATTYGNPHDIADGMIVSDKTTTSYTIVIAPPERDRLFLHDPGANDNFRLADLDFETVRSSRLFHFGYPTLMTSMFRENGRELIEMFRAVDTEGVMTSLDLAAVDEQTEAARADWKTILQNLLPYVDFFMPSYEELARMLDRESLERLRARSRGGDITEALSIEEDVALLAERMINMGAKVVLIKCGAKGFYYRTADDAHMQTLAKKYTSTRAETVNANTPVTAKTPVLANTQVTADTPSHANTPATANTPVTADTSSQAHSPPHANTMAIDGSLSGWSNRAGFEKSYAPEKILSGTGAGDTTIAAFLSAMLQGYPFERCIQLASATGASCVEAYDALGGLKTFAELEKKIDAHWRKTW